MPTSCDEYEPGDVRRHQNKNFSLVCQLPEFQPSWYQVAARRSFAAPLNEYPTAEASMKKNKQQVKKASKEARKEAEEEAEEEAKAQKRKLLRKLPRSGKRDRDSNGLRQVLACLAGKAEWPGPAALHDSSDENDSRDGAEKEAAAKEATEKQAAEKGPTGKAAERKAATEKAAKKKAAAAKEAEEKAAAEKEAAAQKARRLLFFIRRACPGPSTPHLISVPSDQVQQLSTGDGGLWCPVPREKLNGVRRPAPARACYHSHHP